MLVHEAHSALSNMLGDPVEMGPPPVLSIPDGVTFSKALRDMYLYRAMVSIIEETLKSVSGGARDVISSALQRTFPNYLVEDVIAAPFDQVDKDLTLSRTAAWVYAVYGNLGGVRMPFIHETPATFVARSNPAFSTANKHEPMWTYLPAFTSGASQIRVRVRSSFLSQYSGADLHVFMLPMPLKPSEQDPMDLLDFEPSQYDRVLARANQYGRIDSQDLGQQELLGEITKGI